MASRGLLAVSAEDPCIEKMIDLVHKNVKAYKDDDTNKADNEEINKGQQSMNELNKKKSEFGIDFQLKLNSAQWGNNELTLSSEGEESEDEEEEKIEDFRQMKDSFLAKVLEFYPSDEDEIEESMENNNDRLMYYIQLDVFDLDFCTNMDGLKEEICALMFQDENYKKIGHN